MNEMIPAWCAARIKQPAVWIVLVCTAVQFWFWMRQFGPHVAEFVDYANRILNGHPDWRAVQARLLGPLILKYAFGWLPAPLPCFTAVFLAFCNSLFYRVALEMTGKPATSLGLLACSIAIWLLLLFKLSFTFDLIEMSVLIWFFRTTVSKPSAAMDRTVIALFVIQLLNRESALFMAAYLAICGVLRLLMNDRPQFAWREIGWGSGLFATGALIIEFIRKSMFIIGPAARAGADLRHRHFENFIIYQKNRVFFFVDLHRGWSAAKGPMCLVILIVLHLAITLFGITRKSASVSAYGIAMLLYSVAIFFTAELVETRVMQVLVPAAVLAVAWLISRKPAASTLAPERV